MEKKRKLRSSFFSFLFFYLRSLIKEKLSLFHLHYQLKLPKVNDALLSALDKSCRKGD